MAKNENENKTATPDTDATVENDVNARLAALEEKYRKKLAELEAKLDEASEKSEDTPSLMSSGKVVRDITRAKGDDYVEIRLFKDGDKYKDDVFAGVNGKMCQIRRGVPVKVQRKYANVIADSENESAIVNAKLASKNGKLEHYTN